MKTKNTGTEEGYEIYYKSSDSATEELKYYLNVKSNPYGLVYSPESFGFFSSHFQHGCYGIGKFELESVSVRYRKLF